LNTYVAITVALLATFAGLCKVKDDNIVQAMQQAQADKIDHWSFYQARNLRQEIAEATVAQLEAASTGQPAAVQARYAPAIARYRALATDQATKKLELMKQAAEDQRTYDALNFHDDQFDLSDALTALAISLLALTSLTHKRWLFGVALVATALGVLMGMAGLFGWPIHPDAISRLLS
jgi:formate dehydrogenase maturation protein FdhE